MQRPSHLVFLILSLIVISLFALACGSASQQPTSFNVQVGAEDKTTGANVEEFFPKAITINAGDTLVFNKTTAEPHDVAFNVPLTIGNGFIERPDGLELDMKFFAPSPAPPGPPAPLGTPINISAVHDGSTAFIQSGAMFSNNDVYRVTFTSEGPYEFFCLFHPTHKGTVTVQKAGSKYPKTAADITKDNAKQVADSKAAANKVKNDIKVPEPVASGDGSKTYTVYAGVGDDKGHDVLAFVGGEKLTVKTGDKVTFDISKNQRGIPHTVSFLSGAQHPNFGDFAMPDPKNPMKVIVNPQVLMPSPLPPTAPYAGTGYYNSGLLVTSGPTPQNYTLQFTKAGTYQYMCILHDSSGMNGIITVQ